MKFLIDNQLPPALAKFLIQKGYIAEHVFDLGLSEACDADICRYAAKNSLIIVSKDEDFSQTALRPDPIIQVVWVRLGNCRKAALLAAFESSLPAVLRAIEAGERLIEVR